jgi:hypothetical protein
LLFIDVGGLFGVFKVRCTVDFPKSLCYHVM